MLLDGAGRDEEPVRDGLIRAALGHQLEHLALARREERERIVLARAAEQLGDDGRVEHGSVLGDSAHGGRELVEVRDAILEEVADPARDRREEAHRERGLDVLREDEHAGLRIALADLGRGS